MGNRDSHEKSVHTGRAGSKPEAGSGPTGSVSRGEKESRGFGHQKSDDHGMGAKT